jgi:hypothetical protein
VTSTNSGLHVSPREYVISTLWEAAVRLLVAVSVVHDEEFRFLSAITLIPSIASLIVGQLPRHLVPLATTDTVELGAESVTELVNLVPLEVNRTTLPPEAVESFTIVAPLGIDIFSASILPTTGPVAAKLL